MPVARPLSPTLFTTPGDGEHDDDDSHGTVMWETVVLYHQLCGWLGHLLVGPSTLLAPPRSVLNHLWHSFGYDQGVMGGVNTSPDYVTTMGLGYTT